MDGLVILDKPAGKTSHDVVAEVKRILKADKAGHTGTLDPLATGVLPVLINEGTKLSPFLVNDTKEYRATILLGVRTDTLDITGEVLERTDPDVRRDAVVRAVEGLLGTRIQVPPLYSAVKVHGRPLHRWARKGIQLMPEPRTVEVLRIGVDEVDLPRVAFSVSCSKGTYIRSLCEDIGDILGCGATLTALRRTRSGSFSEEAALLLDGLTDGEKKTRLSESLIPPAEAISGVKAVYVDASLAEKIRNGHQLTGSEMRGDHIPFLVQGDMIKLINLETGLVAVAETLCCTEEMIPDSGTMPVARTLRVFKSQKMNQP
jgi:tRNA pseudouridine55 synthase